ncbi:MAG: prolipoprotein diacylglyceryl transferase [Spirochaetia bacterium]
MLLYLNFPAWLSPEIFPKLPWLSFLRWYSLAYLLGFLIAYKIFVWILNREKKPLLNSEQATDFALLLMICLILGGRLGYVLIYDPAYFFGSWQAFLSILLPFSFEKNPITGQSFTFTGISGLSYHGAVIGVIIAMFITKKIHKISFWKLSDSLLPAVALVYTLGRFGNFANQELYGKVTANPLGMIFPSADSILIIEAWAKSIAEKTGLLTTINEQAIPLLNLPRHPSQIYEALSEGLLLGLILLFMTLKIKKIIPGMISATYLFGYGFVRFFIEYVREPDPQLGFIIRGGVGAENPEVFTSLLNLSMGQVLCALMMLAGLAVATYAYIIQKKAHPSG